MHIDHDAHSKRFDYSAKHIRNAVENNPKVAEWHRIYAAGSRDGGRCRPTGGRLAGDHLEGAQRAADVSPPTRARIEKLLEEHGYERRGNRDVSKGGFIELVFHELDPLWSMELLAGVEAVAKHHGLSVVLTVSGDRRSPDPTWIEGVLRRRPVGIVLVFSDIPEEQRDRLRSRAMPFVVVDPAGEPPADAPYVGSANWSGGLTATRHLIALGHTRIAAITGMEEMMCSFARVDGYRSAMNSAGLEIDPAWIRFGNFRVSGGYDHAMDLLSLPNRPTAIFAGSDLQALGVMDAARAKGLHIPEELSVVSYDDIALSQWVTPRLTTIHQPLRRMGEEAARLAIRLSEGAPPTALRLDLAINLVVRESTAPPVVMM